MCERCEDGQRCGAVEDALIDAEEPEWWEAEDDGASRGEQRLDGARDGREEQKDREEEHHAAALQQRSDAAEEVFANGVEQDALHGEDGGRGEGSADGDSDGVCEKMAAGVGEIRHHGEKECAEEVGAEQNEREEDGDREDSGLEEAAVCDGQDGEDVDVEEVGEEEVPLVDGGCSHDDEGVHDEEVVVGDLRPEGARVGVRREGVVGREEVHGDEQRGQSDEVADLQDAFGFVVGGEELVVEEAVEEVADEDFKLRLWAAHCGRGLRSEGENGGFGRGEECWHVLSLRG
ncbi:hypothetical protein GOB94_12500 [Granulicella sp. 5B5]|nr:hypothetical protein GOB94_12500 [Granulicella sp. 5B5]